MSDARSSGRVSSLGGMLGSGAGKLFRLLRGKPGRNAMGYGGFRKGVTAFMAPVMGALRVLFLEVSGLIYLVFSVVIVSAFFREYKRYATHEVGVWHAVLAGAIGTMFLYFGLSSFWRARRKRERI